MLLIAIMFMNISILEARFTPAPGANPEYAQGAIERCEARHREIREHVWVIADEQRRTPEEWAHCLNVNLEKGAGHFEVREADEELRGKVLRGEIPLQK